MSNDFTREQGGLVGAIRPGEAGEPPLFRRIKHDYDAERAGPNVRPCNHREFICDEKFSTVTCGKCHTEVQPFDALMILVESWERVVWDRKAAEDAERRATIAELRRLARLRCMTDDERAEITKAVGDFRLTAHDVAQIASRYRKVESLRRSERRTEKRRRTRGAA